MMSRRVAALALLTAIGLSACGKQEPAPGEPTPRAQASPSPPASPGTVADELDAGSDRMKKKASDAMASLDSYLKDQNPRLRERFQKAAEKFTRDKEKWREKLREKQKELQPQIDRLRERVGKLDGKTRDELSQELARLQDQSKNTDQKLAELEAAGHEGWKAFKARLKEEEAKEAATTPTPSPARSTP